MRRQDGFTLIEALVAMGLAAILVTLSAGALRNYWLTQSLYGARDEAVSQLRALQEQAVSETHPKVFGARFRVGSSSWSLVEYDPNRAVGSRCTEIDDVTFGTGVQVTAATSFSISDVGTACKAEHTDWGSDQLVFFYARGTATQGTLELTHPSLGRSVSLTVTPVTGRVSAS